MKQVFIPNAKIVRALTEKYAALDDDFRKGLVVGLVLNMMSKKQPEGPDERKSA